MKTKTYAIIITALYLITTAVCFAMIKRDAENRAFKAKLTEYYILKDSPYIAIETAYNDSIDNLIEYYITK